MKTSKLLFLLLSLLIAGGCKKANDEKKTLNGSYSGKLVVTPISAANQQGVTFGADVLFSLQNGKFRSTNPSANYFVGNGTYLISNQTILFTDTSAAAYIKGNFPFTPRLNGSFTYSVKDDSVFLSLPVFGTQSGLGYSIAFKLKRN